MNKSAPTGQPELKPKTVKQLHSTVRDDIDDLVTRRALPTPSIEHLDPFLFLNHHGPQTYPAHNRGLPFGPHPHRGFETVTFILKGELAHNDTGGHESIIREGGVQWMTAGSGLVHSEISPKAFLEKGGPLEILQLWLNLPAKLKMTKPRYRGLQRAEIPVVKGEHYQSQIVSGAHAEIKGAFQPLTVVELQTLFLKPGAKMDLSIPEERTVFFYVVRGAVRVNGVDAMAFQLVEFARDGQSLRIEATQDAVVLLGHATPYGEPIVAHGPFVMNTREEIQQAIRDYQAGKFV